MILGVLKGLRAGFPETGNATGRIEYQECRPVQRQF